MNDEADKSGWLAAATAPDDTSPIGAASVQLEAPLDPEQTIQLLQEALHVSKREVVAGTIRVVTRTELSQAAAAVSLDRSVVEVTRVPVNKKIAVPPDVRTEGDTTIVPVLEERAVTVKHLYLVEEIHIRRSLEQETARTTVQVRRQVATIERLDGDGHPVSDAEPQRDSNFGGQHHGHS